MIKLTFSFLLLWASTTTGFSPLVPTSKKTPVLKSPPTTTLSMVKKDKPMFEWMEQIADFFEELTHKQKDWVADSFNEANDDEKEKDVTVAADENLTSTEEVVNLVEPEPKLTEPETPLEPETKTIVNEKTAKKKSKPSVKNAWVQHDMEQTGKTESETKDWVAKDMNKVGKFGSSHTKDWVEKDMVEAGHAGVDRTQPNKDTQTKKSRFDRIAGHMKTTGKRVTEQEKEVAKDMESLGRAKESLSRDKLDKALKEERDHRYKDLYNNTEKAGRIGSHSTDWVAQDLQRAGLAENTNHLKYDESYELGSWTKKAFDVDEIRQDLETAGRAKSQDWIADDLRFAGKDKSLQGHQYPNQEKDLKDFLSKKQVDAAVVKDLLEEGKPTPGRVTSRVDNVSRQKMQDLVAQDMKLMGRTSLEEDISQDMERTAHSGTHLETVFEGQSHQQRETKEFMKNRKPGSVMAKNEHVESTKKATYAPWIHADDNNNDDEDINEKQDSSHTLGQTVKRAAKKVLHPKTPWKEL